MFEGDPNAGMVVTADIGNRTCVHPSDKESVGKRLALWALAKTYQRSGTPYSGPLYKSFTIDKEKIIVEFDYAEMGMTSYDRKLSDLRLQEKMVFIIRRRLFFLIIKPK